MAAQQLVERMRRRAEGLPPAGDAHPILAARGPHVRPRDLHLFRFLRRRTGRGLVACGFCTQPPATLRLCTCAECVKAPAAAEAVAAHGWVVLRRRSCCILHGFRSPGGSFSAFRRQRRPFLGRRCPHWEAPPLLAMAFPLRWCRTHIIEYSTPHTCLAGLCRSAVGNSCLSRSAIAGF